MTRRLPLLLAALALVLVPSPASAAAPASPASAVTGAETAGIPLARGGRGLGGRSLGGGRSYRRGSRGYRRPVRPGRVFRSVLRALGIAFLINALFGWGAGGSPFGLLLLMALIALIVVSRRRRRPAYAMR